MLSWLCMNQQRVARRTWTKARKAERRVFRKHYTENFHNPAIICPIAPFPGKIRTKPDQGRLPLTQPLSRPIPTVPTQPRCTTNLSLSTVSAFEFEDLSGECLHGQPDIPLITEAMTRFRHAQNTFRGQRLDILEFPYTTSKHARPSQDNVFVRYHRDLHRFEIKVYEVGHYNAKKLLGHFLLQERKPEDRYEMTIS